MNPTRERESSYAKALIFFLPKLVFKLTQLERKRGREIYGLLMVWGQNPDEEMERNIQIERKQAIFLDSSAFTHRETERDREMEDRFLGFVY